MDVDVRRRGLVVGHRGGVGATLLELLVRHPVPLDALFVVDREAGPSRSTARVLDPDAAADPEALARTLRDHRIDQVIEVADVDTAQISEVCAAVGADYLSASIVSDAPTLQATRALFGEHRRTSQLIGAGMNPGVVNALVLAGIDEFARRAGVPAAKLDLYAIHITEEDTTAIRPIGGSRSTAGSAWEQADVFAMSWSPEHALDELLEPHAMYVDRGELKALDHRPCDALYAARCGDREIAGMVVPHEELIAIGARFPNVETAFFYAIPDAAAAALRRHPHRRPDEWRTRRLYGPHARHLVGRDRVGVLLASRRHGELWIGYEHAAATRGAGNGTLLQAAAGVLAGWTQLGVRRGIHSVDQLDVPAYLASVESLLGPRRVVHIPDAITRTLAMRRTRPLCSALLARSLEDRFGVRQPPR
jgi:hypothetical protein